MTTNEPSTELTKICKGCGQQRPLEQFSKNPNATSGRNSIARCCRGKTTNTQRGRRRELDGLRVSADSRSRIDRLYEEYATGDRKKDLLIMELCELIVTARNEQSRLTAIQKIIELHGIDNETPQSDKDLVHAAFIRMKTAAATESEVSSGS